MNSSNARFPSRSETVNRDSLCVVARATIFSALSLTCRESKKVIGSLDGAAECIYSENVLDYMFANFTCIISLSLPQVNYM